MSRYTYCVIPADNLGEIDFSQVRETSENTVGKSLDDSLAMLKFLGDPSAKPPTLESYSTINHAAALATVRSATWLPEPPP